MNLNGIKLTWLGHATFRMETPGGKTIFVDPWVMGNPMCPEKNKDIKNVDIGLCTHRHFDHIGDAVEIAKKHKPTVVAIPELAHWLEKKGVQQVSSMNKGGTQTVADIKVTMVHADHSCGITDGDQIVYGGEACGLVIEFENGFTVYFAGDTDVFGDMALYAELGKFDVAFLPIGGFYTMGPERAAKAVELLGVKTVVPMHFGTFPILAGKPSQLQELVGSAVEVLDIKPGDTV